jgi:cytochrome c biogenesis protein CcmG, thiol:disulfide interchange protein DsbE
MARRARLVAQGVAIGLVALLFILLAWSLLNDEGGNLAAAANRGDRPAAPGFALERLDEEGELDLTSLRGKVVVLNFWASWCTPCKEEAPVLEGIWRDGTRRDLAVVGLDARDFRGDAHRFMRRFGITFPVVYDGPGDIADDYGVTGLPETFVIDREGRIVAAFIGAVNGEEERSRLESAIGDALST